MNTFSTNHFGQEVSKVTSVPKLSTLKVKQHNPNICSLPHWVVVYRIFLEFIYLFKLFLVVYCTIFKREPTAFAQIRRFILFVEFWFKNGWVEPQWNAERTYKLLNLQPKRYSNFKPCYSQSWQQPIKCTKKRPNNLLNRSGFWTDTTFF